MQKGIKEQLRLNTPLLEMKYLDSSRSPYTVLFLPHSVEHYNIGMLEALQKWVKVLTWRPKILIRGLRGILKELIKLLNDQLIIHANTAFEAREILKYVNNAKVVVVEHGYPDIEDERIRNEKELYIASLKELDALLEIYYEYGLPLITISEFSARELHKRYGVKVYKVIHHGVLDAFRTERPREYPRRDVIKILSVVHLHPIDSPELLIEATGKIPSSYREKLFILLRGDGPLKHDIVRKLKDLSIRFKLIPRLPFSYMPYVYKTADIYIHTSHIEGFGFPIVEAMASGLPTIVPSYGAAPEICSKCIHFKAYDSSDLADKIFVVINDAEKYNRLSSMCLNESRRFSWRKTALKYLQIYNQLIKVG